jgi:MtaA/CmuA family methyltransferase
MTGLERTISFIRGEAVDHPPFHPIIMRWAAKQAGVKYRDFCLDPFTKCRAMSECAREFGIDWVTVMSDPWAEASAFGISVDYPEDNLPVDTGGHFPDAVSAAKIRQYDVRKNLRCMNRLTEISEFRRWHGDELFIVGWVEGPVAEYVDLRKATEASVDFFLDPESVSTAMDTIVESAKVFITMQVEAGAHCIGIGDAFCSQIGPDLYEEFAFARHKILVDHIHSCGAVAKLHICGNTESILPSMIATCADIIDIDHLVSSMSDYVRLLRRGQVFSGKADPVSVIQNGNKVRIRETVLEDFTQSGRRCIISAGCEITPGTSAENMKAFMQSAREMRQGSGPS